MSIYITDWDYQSLIEISTWDVVWNCLFTTILSKFDDVIVLQPPLMLVSVQGSPVPSGRVEFERLLRESQREVLRLQRQLSVTSSSQQYNHSPDPSGPEKCGQIEEVEEEEEGEGEKKVVIPSYQNTTLHWPLLVPSYINKLTVYMLTKADDVKATVTFSVRAKDKWLNKFPCCVVFKIKRSKLLWMYWLGF